MVDIQLMIWKFAERFMQPVVSVLLPVYNGELFLASALTSILAQTFTDFELLVLNDGSTDGSRSIAERFAGQDERVKVLSSQNRGIVRTLNAGIEQARGSLIARMDADDIARPTRFARQVQFLDAHPEVVALGTHCLLIDTDGDPICPWFVLLETHEEIDRRLLGPDGGGTLIHPTVMMRRQDVVALGGYRTEYEWAEDLDLFLRLAERGRLGNLPDVLLDYRQHFASVGLTKKEKQVDAARRALQDAWQRRAMAGSAPTVAPPKASSRVELLQSWTWLALGAGNVGTARKLGWWAVRAAPKNLASWRAFAAAIRGH